MAAETDRVVAEMDVFSCRTLLGEQTQLNLFQYPLRPPWRPYDMDECTQLKVKPVAKRIMMTVPLDVHGEHYNEDVGETMQIKHLTLQSRPANLTSSHALCHIRDGKVLLLPLDDGAQFRPHMGHLDEPVLKEPAQEPSAKSDTELVALQVQVQRRETERQIQNKLNSHAYISQMEADEPWVEVDVAGNRAAESFWQQLSDGPGDALPMNLSRKDYLTAILPGGSAEQFMTAQSPPTSPRPSLHRPQPNTKAAASKGNAAPVKTEIVVPDVQLNDEERASLEKALTGLFRNEACTTLPKIRNWLGDSTKKLPELERFLKMSDLELHSVLSGLEIVAHCRACYVQLPKDDATVRSFRKVVLGLLEQKPGVKKAEIVAAVKKGDLDVSDTQSIRLIKDICRSQGAMWQLKHP